MTYFKKVAIGFDQFLNTLFNGYPDETLSARAWRMFLEDGTRWPFMIIDALLFWDDWHCKESYESEWNNTQLPKHYRP